MNFYSFHIGDYAAHTKHLSLLEDLAYRRMIDLYYTNEKPLFLEPERVARLIGMRDHIQEVSDVLSDFFIKTDDGFINKRCDEEIERARERLEETEGRRENERERQKRHRDRRKELFLRLRDVGIVPPWDTSTEALQALLDKSVSQAANEPVTRDVTANHKPHTINHEPLTNNQENKHTDVITPCQTEKSENPVCDFTPTPVGLCCKAIIQQGIKSTSQHNPTFLALIDAGATEQEFAEAAKTAVSKGNRTFGYVLGIVKKQREDAAKLLLHRGPLPTKQESLEQENKEATQRAKARLFGVQTEKDITNEATRL
jgi:uncharacterized protein YdaU (DUF1376 family)